MYIHNTHVPLLNNAPPDVAEKHGPITTMARLANLLLAVTSVDNNASSGNDMCPLLHASTRAPEISSFGSSRPEWLPDAQHRRPPDELSMNSLCSWLSYISISVLARSLPVTQCHPTLPHLSLVLLLHLHLYPPPQPSHSGFFHAFCALNAKSNVIADLHVQTV